MILIYSLTVNANRNHLFAKQLKTFIRKIKGELRIPPMFAANPTAISPALSDARQQWPWRIWSEIYRLIISAYDDL